MFNDIKKINKIPLFFWFKAPSKKWVLIKKIES